jgi:hypothetical protein
MSALEDEMRAHAREAQKYSRRHLVLELDFSEASLTELDNQCDAVEYAIRGGKSPENIEMLTRLWGAYVGEALRRVAAAEWFAEEGGRRGLMSPEGKMVFPHASVRQRLENKAAESLPDFFRSARSTLQG